LSDQFRHVFDRAEIESSHAQELLPGIPIQLDGDIIDIEEGVRSVIHNPHRMRIGSELHTVYLAFWRGFVMHTLNARPYSATRREPKEGTPRAKGLRATSASISATDAIAKRTEWFKLKSKVGNTFGSSTAKGRRSETQAEWKCGG
jgi:hypothetical protein